MKACLRESTLLVGSRNWHYEIETGVYYPATVVRLFTVHQTVLHKSEKTIFCNGRVETSHCSLRFQVLVFYVLHFFCSTQRSILCNSLRCCVNSMSQCPCVHSLINMKVLAFFHMSISGDDVSVHTVSNRREEQTCFIFSCDPGRQSVQHN